MKRLIPLCVALFCVAHVGAFEVKDGDRVVLIGSTLIEREQRYGYWEAAITARNPDKNITFRNLGWSGDTVWGEARAEFGTAADGYKHLVDHVRAEKPTVIIVGYGTNESFAGPEGLPKFKEQLKKLLDDLSTTNARFVFILPIKMPKGSPNRDRANQNIELYAKAIKEEATRRVSPDIQLDNFVWEQAETIEPVRQVSLHLTAAGYEFASDIIAAHFGGAERMSQITFDPLKKTCVAAGPAMVIHDGDALQFRVTARAITIPNLEAPNQRGIGLFINEGDPSRYQLTIDGQPVKINELPAKQRRIVSGPELEQGRKLLQTIIAKNELYFHRWRPQNTTYLFGFRKHEQGQNAREIPQFDPLVAAKEKEIAELKKPREHIYELIPTKEKK